MIPEQMYRILSPTIQRCEGGTSLAVGHIPGFQIDTN